MLLLYNLHYVKYPSNGESITTFLYDSQNQVSSQISESYANDSLSSTNTNIYEFDARNNITTVVQTLIDARRPTPPVSSRRKATYVYDQGANPYYSIPSVVYRLFGGGGASNSPNNFVLDAYSISDQLTGLYPSDAYTETYVTTNTYQDGLLVERYLRGQTTRFVYENYQ